MTTNTENSQQNSGYSFKNYVPPVPSQMMLILWWLTGIDSQILKRATFSEHVKYQCMGWIVLGTGFVATLSMGYAIHLIWGSIIMAIIGGIFWGALIVGIERFIISSTGIGDGTSNITFMEFVYAIPRLCLATIVGVCVSEPLQLFMFQPEITKVFRQKAELIAKKSELEFDNSEQAKDLQRKISEFQKTKDDLDKQASENDRLAAKENTTEKGGCGPKCTEFKARAGEFRISATAYSDSITKYMNRKTELRKTAGEQAKSIAIERPGMLEQITTLHSIPDAETPTLWIMGFFIMIDITPIFFKMMLAIGSYFYLGKMVELLVLAGYGVEKKEGYTKTDKEGKGEEGQYLDAVTMHEVDLANSLKRRSINIQKGLSHYALTLFQKRKMKEIKSEPDKYVKEDGVE